MPVRERERDDLPFPICPCSTERSGGDLMFLGERGKIILVLVLVLEIYDLRFTRMDLFDGTDMTDRTDLAQACQRKMNAMSVNHSWHSLIH